QNGSTTTWNPEPNNNIYALTADNNYVYAGGSFTSVAGQTRNRLAGISTSNSTVLSTLNSNVSNSVRFLAIFDSTLYVSGDFSGIKQYNLSNNSLIAITGIYVDGPVYSIAKANGILYLGGDFSTVNSQKRSNFAAVDLNLLDCIDFDPSPDGKVHAIK